MRQSRRHTLLLGYIMSRIIHLPFSHYIYNVCLLLGNLLAVYDEDALSSLVNLYTIQVVNSTISNSSIDVLNTLATPT